MTEKKTRQDILGPIKSALQNGLFLALTTGDFAAFEELVTGHAMKEPVPTRKAFAEVVEPIRGATKAAGKDDATACFDRLGAALAPKPKIEGLLRLNKRHTFISTPDVGAFKGAGALKMTVILATSPDTKDMIVLEPVSEEDYQAAIAAVAVKA